MANMSDWLEKKLLNHIFRGQEFNAPSSIWVALCNDTLDDTIEDATPGVLPEITGQGYVRKQILSNGTKWTDPANDAAQIIKNADEVKWEKVQWEDTVKAVALCTDQSGGNVLFWGDLTREKVVTIDDSISFAANSLSIQIDN